MQTIGTNQFIHKHLQMYDHDVLHKTEKQTNLYLDKLQ